MPWPVERHASARNFCAIATHVSYARRSRGLQCGLHSFQRIRQSLLLLVMACVIAQAQSTPTTVEQIAPTRAPGSLDTDVATPNATGTLGRQDAAALKEITEHLAIVGSAQWLGMRGTGQIVYGSKDPTAYSATLSMMGSYQVRLDAETNKGEMSIRIHGGLGKIKSGDGTMSSMPFDTAMSGLFPFALPRLKNFPGPTGSLLDHGLTTIGGTELHRITFEVATIGRNPVTKSRQTVATDLYFDPTSHLLVKSSTASAIADGRNVKFLFVVTYDDYRKVGTSMVPFRYTETMDGEQYWTLQLSEVQLNPQLPSTYFEF
jgi:hypothetical protein